MFEEENKIFFLWDNKFTIDRYTCDVYLYDNADNKWIFCNNKDLGYSGYINITLINDEKIKKTFKLHRIIYYAFYPSWNIYDNTNKNYIYHKDYDSANNHITNLYKFNKSHVYVKNKTLPIDNTWIVQRSRRKRRNCKERI